MWSWFIYAIIIKILFSRSNLVSTKIFWIFFRKIFNPFSSLKKEGSHKKCYPHFLVHILMFTHTDINILFSWKEEAWEQRCWGALFRKKGENLSSWWHHTATELNSGSAWPLQSLLYEILIFSHWIGIFFSRQNNLISQCSI